MPSTLSEPRGAAAIETAAATSSLASNTLNPLVTGSLVPSFSVSDVARPTALTLGQRVETLISEIDHPAAQSMCSLLNSKGLERLRALDDVVISVNRIDFSQELKGEISSAKGTIIRLLAPAADGTGMAPIDELKFGSDVGVMIDPTFRQLAVRNGDVVSLYRLESPSGGMDAAEAPRFVAQRMIDLPANALPKEQALDFNEVTGALEIALEGGTKLTVPRSESQHVDLRGVRMPAAVLAA